MRPKFETRQASCAPSEDMPVGPSACHLQLPCREIWLTMPGVAGAVLYPSRLLEMWTKPAGLCRRYSWLGLHDFCSCLHDAQQRATQRPSVYLHETALTQGRCSALTDYLNGSAQFGSSPAAARDTLWRRLSH